MKILISPGYGAGWSTWNSGDVAEYMRTYKPIIKAIESRKFSMSESHTLVAKLQKECKEKFGETYVCVLGATGLIVENVTPPFKITEYDGSESITSPGDSEDWVME